MVSIGKLKAATKFNEQFMKLPGVVAAGPGNRGKETCFIVGFSDLEALQKAKRLMPDYVVGLPLRTEIAGTIVGD